MLNELRDYKKNGLKLQKACSISKDDLKKLHLYARVLYAKKKYKKSLHIFYILTLMRPCSFKYVFGLAACYQMLKKYRKAIASYILASMLNSKDPTVHYHIAECYLNVDDFIAAIISLKETIKKIENNVKFKKLKEHATLLKNAIYKQLRA